MLFGHLNALLHKVPVSLVSPLKKKQKKKKKKKNKKKKKQKKTGCGAPGWLS